jgi:hypothetical protein
VKESHNTKQPLSPGQWLASQRKTTRLKDLVGQQFGRLTVTGMVDRTLWRGKNSEWYCSCGCGTEKKIIKSSDLKSGNVNSCGCLKREKNAKRFSTHGHFNHPLYSTWHQMIHRCENPNMPNYKNYGARGIKVCKRWKHFPNFVADMGEKPSEKHSIDRINNDDDYSPENCKWSTPSEQMSNRRIKRKVIRHQHHQAVGQLSLPI